MSGGMFIQDRHLYADGRPRPTKPRGKQYRAWNKTGPQDLSPYFATLEEAEAQLAKWRSQVAAALPAEPVAPLRAARGKQGPTVSQYWDQWWPLQTGNTTRTTEARLATWQGHVLPKIGHLAVADIDQAVLAAMLDTWYATLAVTTAKIRYRETIAQLLRAALDDGTHPGPDPMKRIRFRQVEDSASTEDRAPDNALTEAEANEVIRHMSPRWRMMAQLAKVTGMRIGELRGLRWANVVIANDRVTIKVIEQIGYRGTGSKRTDKVPAFVRPKGGKTRTVVAPAWIGPLLEAHRAQHPNRWGLVFPNTQGNAWSRQSPVKAWLDMLARWGKDPAIDGQQYRGWHQLRHHYASEMLHHGVPAPVVAAQLGHTLAVLQKTYAHWMPNHQANDLLLASIGGPA